MIRYTGKTMGPAGIEKLIGIGISRGDLDRLLRGEKLVFRLEQHGLEPGQAVVFFGETEAEMTQGLEKYMKSSVNVILGDGVIKSS